MTPSLRKNSFQSLVGLLDMVATSSCSVLTALSSTPKNSRTDFQHLPAETPSPLQTTRLHRRESVPHQLPLMCGPLCPLETLMLPFTFFLLSPKLWENRPDSAAPKSPLLLLSGCLSFLDSLGRGENASPSSLLNCKGHTSHFLNSAPEALLS